MANDIIKLYDTSKQDISYHLKNIFNSMELEESSTVKNYLTVQKEGKKDIEEGEFNDK